jgi:4-amino-4-deoxy-L-arabinose transferase-like glycosyltransferase
MMGYKNITEFIKALNVKSDNSLTLEKLLERAYDIRKFEIDLYWKRASYFWGFLIATFTAYFIVSDSTKFGSKSKIELLVVCIGFVFSLSWYLVNRGSLFWQYNWERMIEAIEEAVEINYYKVNLVPNYKSYHLFSAHPYSLGRINIMVSFFVCLVWLTLIGFYFFYPYNTISFHKQIDYGKLILALITVTFSLILLYKGKSPSNKIKSFSFESRNLHYKNSG